MSRFDHSAMARRVRIAEVTLAMIVVLGALVIGRQIVTGSMFSRPYEVTIAMPDAAGLHPHSDVTYRGQHIGTITRVTLTATGIKAVAAIDSDVRVPRDTDVVIANLSAVGEQYVDFRPRSTTGPYLRDGSTLIGNGDDVPLPTYQLLNDAQSLLKRIDVNDMRVISREVKAIFDTPDVNVKALSDDIGATLDLMEQLSPDMVALLRQGKAPLSAIDDLAPKLRDFMTQAATITAAMKESNPTIQKLIDQGALLIPVITTEFDRVQPSLISLLNSGTPVAQMAGRHLRGLQHWYEFGPLQFQAMAEATAGHHAHVILAFRVPQNCHYGPDVSPYDMHHRIPWKAKCTTVSPTMQQRGSQYVPRQ